MKKYLFHSVARTLPRFNQIFQMIFNFMKSIKPVFIAGILAFVILLSTAFMTLQRERTIEKRGTTAAGQGFAVVELFTSEGCSSCPPADALIEEIQKNNKNPHLYILAFHVDYWDHLGWKDRFSDHEYSVRQNRYAHWLNTQTVYTPQVVVNGLSEYVGSVKGPILKAIAARLGGKSDTTSTVKGTIVNDQVNIEYHGAGEEKNTELFLVLVQKRANSKIRAGENSGATLAHVQVVRKMIHFPVHIKIKRALAMTLPKNLIDRNLELIGFVQNTSTGQITAASSFALR